MIRRLVGRTEGSVGVRGFDEQCRGQGRLVLIDGIQGDLIRGGNRATVELHGDR